MGYSLTPTPLLRRLDSISIICVPPLRLRERVVGLVVGAGEVIALEGLDLEERLGGLMM